VDVGGTFTDVALERPDGTFASTKVLTTHQRPEEAVVAGISAVIEREGTTFDKITQIIHGTTLATNALIERRGARTALVTTAGFRDVIETRTESRYEQYDLNIVLPAPLIERKDRFIVPERIGARGQVLLAFDEQAARGVVARLVDGGYTSVAVGFMHSYRNPDHERRFRDLLHEAGPSIAVSLSCEVSPQMREFERFNTVCANAYVQPLIGSYLRRLESELRLLGASCPLLLIHSGGGLMSSDAAAALPVRLIESGPAGGAIFAAHLARAHRRDRIVSYDMGGTTAKIALIEDCSPRTAKTFETARTARFKKGSGMPISVPTIEMIEIGAGGGSIASVDALGQIRVGPLSAGADPGPASYDLGGASATVTDANVQMGRLHPGTFGASGISLSPELGADALRSAVGDPLGLDTDGAAVGVAEVVDENMANAARTHAVESGKDLAGYSMVAFGGAAPLHACRLIDKLGGAEVLVPVGAGVGSAIGFLLAPFSYEATRSFYTTSDDFDTEGVRTLLEDLAAEAEAFVRRGTAEAVGTQREVLMRYRGQGWEIPVALPDGEFDDIAAQELAGAFVKAYEAFFGRAIDGLTIEAVSWSVTVSSVRGAPRAVEPAVGATEPLPVGGTRLVYDSDAGTKVAAALYERGGLSAGDTVAGPALITEDQTTTVVSSQHTAVVQPDLTLRITRAGAGAGRRDTASSLASSSRQHRNGEPAAAQPEVPLQIMWNRLISVVEEQALTLVRTAFSTSVREAGDLSAGVFDRSGRMIAQAVTGTPGHVNTMAASLGHFINEIGTDSMRPGDVYLTNDPWKATGHLHDFTVATPVFTGEDSAGAELVGFFASTAHVVDIGGRGFGPDGRELYEEGLRVPIMRWADHRRLNRDLVEIVRSNVREPDQVIGDIHGLAASNETGRRRLLDMLSEFGLADLEELAAFVFDRTRRATLDALGRVPNGVYGNTMRVDGYGDPVTLSAEVTVTDEGMHADFTGTSPVSPFGINVPITYAQAYFTYGMLVALAPELPNNHASLAPFTVSSPPGTILNAVAPDPVAVRHVIGHFVTDLCMGAVAPARPDVVPAEGSGALWNFQASARSADPADPRPPMEILMFNSGGTGARPGLDGLTATAFPSGVRTMSVEATEQVGPIVVWRKEIRDGSGGAGRFRGGLGQVIEIAPADGYLFEFSAMFDRVSNPARGRAGGSDGARGAVRLDDGTPFGSKGKQTVPAGRRLILELPGGGGFGDPAERDPAAAANDLAQGYVT
jgi:N-methylhydantoinase A/oxoprolinase/acetone carboxylase beta subunit/N-methylhydantoinase B/oxoprolinase/acetone carboxylase alpha subunit